MESSEVRIGVTTPPDWFEFDLDPVTGPDAARELVAQHLQRDDLENARAVMEAELRMSIAQARTVGVIAAMGFAELLEEEPWLMSATMTLSMVSTGDEEVSASDIQRRLGERGHTMEAIELPAGPAMRSTGRTEQLLPGSDEAIEMSTAKYFLPVDGGIAVLAFSTPTITLESEFRELFEAIAETLEVM